MHFAPTPLFTLGMLFAEFIPSHLRINCFCENRTIINPLRAFLLRSIDDNFAFVVTAIGTFRDYCIN
jgi:hypothetical protein